MILSMMDNNLFLKSDDSIFQFKTFSDELLHWLHAFSHENPSTFIDNIQTNFKIIKANKTILPLSINDEEYQNSYVVSPYTAFILYSFDEVKKISNLFVRVVLRTLILLFDGFFKAFKINRVIMINNWLLSTNLYPDLEFQEIKQMIDFLSQRYPKHVLIFRSLNSYSNLALISNLKNLGCFLSASRQVYIFDPSSNHYLKRNNCKNDLRLLKKSSYTIVEHGALNENDYQRIVELYNMLYLEKYSVHNPQFNYEFIKLAHQKRTLIMMGFRNSVGKLDGIIGYFKVGNIITAPLVGYDTRIPKEKGLYRLLMIYLLKKTKEENLLLNLSSGASGFKKLRGGKPHIEYSGIYIKHLPIYLRLFWRFIQFLTNFVAKPILKKYEL